MKSEVGMQNAERRRSICFRSVFCILTCASLLVGCANKNQQIVDRAIDQYFTGDYDTASKTLKPLAEKTNEDFVVNNLRLGSATLPPYDLEESEAAFLRAIEVINSTGVNNGGRTLGAVLVDEKIKVWKGEPFERAMASFYLGVIYYIRHDYNNARASFENALFKLRDYDPDKPQDAKDIDSNFAPAMLMLAKCYQRLGREDLSKANFDSVMENYPRLVSIANEKINAESNLLLVVDYGHGPRKVTNEDGVMVGFGPLPQEEGPIPSPIIRVDGAFQSVSDIVSPPVDLLALAQQRRWQSIDTIRTFKSVLGTGLLVGGAVEGVRGLNGSGARQRTDLMVSGALIGAGLLLKATSQADIRQWEMLPRTTFIIPLHVAPGTHDVSVEFPNGVRQTWRGLSVPDTGEAAYYFRMQRWISGPFNWPPPAMAKTE